MQALIESLLLSLLGSIAGLLVAYWGGAGIRRLLIASDDAPLEVFTDWRTLGVAIGAALLAALLTGIAPSFVSMRGDLANTLKTGARAGGGSYQRSRARTALLVVQGALSVVLLIGAGLFVESLDNVKRMRIGYDAASTPGIARAFSTSAVRKATLAALSSRIPRMLRLTNNTDSAS